MAGYLTVSQFKDRTIMPAGYVDAIEQVHPGWTATQLEQVSRWMDGRLGKRYATPFAEPAPEIVRQWLTRIVTYRAFLRRGVDPNDAQFGAIRDDHNAAVDELKETADGQIGNFDLPMSDAAAGSAVKYGGPRVYSEASPYVYSDVQRETAWNEDQFRRGSD